MDTTWNMTLALSATIQKFRLRFVTSLIATILNSVTHLIILRDKHVVNVEIFNNSVLHHMYFVNHSVVQLKEI